jgi:uncharacterized OB-fold protein
MSDGAGVLAVNRCVQCHARFLSRPGRCPKCGSREVTQDEIPARATVIAATELTSPPEGVPAPHPLLLLEGEEGVRLLATIRGQLPAIGTVVSIVREGEVYFATPEPAGEPITTPGKRSR